MRFIGFDCESTEASPGGRLLELGAVVPSSLVPFHLWAPFRTYVDPQMPIPELISRQFGITADTIAGAPYAGEALQQFLDWLAADEGDPVLVIHNAAFDCRLVQWDADRVGVSWPQDLPVICTLELARSLNETKNNKLATLCDHHRIAVPGPEHSAVPDAERALRYFAMMTGGGGSLARPWGEWVNAGRGRYTETFPAGFEAFPELVRVGGSFSFDYTDAKGKSSRRTIIPAGWADLGDGVLSFHGFCTLRGDMREFRSDRVVAVQRVAF